MEFRKIAIQLTILAVIANVILSYDTNEKILKDGKFHISSALFALALPYP